MNVYGLVPGPKKFSGEESWRAEIFVPRGGTALRGKPEHQSTTAIRGPARKTKEEAHADGEALEKEVNGANQEDAAKIARELVGKMQREHKAQRREGTRP